MADDQQFCLRWNNFQTNFTSQFKALRVEEDFVDVTLACEGKRLKAHKLVLSACSPYFKDLFKGNPCKHPIIFMQDVEFEHLMNLIEFMYAGQVNICQTKLPAFLHTAESLQIRGLSAQSQKELPEINDTTCNDLRPAPTISGNSPDLRNDSLDDNLIEEEGDDRTSLSSNKRLCLSLDNTSQLSRDSNSYSDLPTTALIETKMEPMDYYSDGELQNVTQNSNSEIPSRSGYSLQGALDAAASMSAQISQLQETSQESLQDLVGEMCKPHSLEPPSVIDPFKPHSLDPRPCPECGRIYSNISNLRQHIRLIHHPECITCPLCFKPFKNKLYLRRHVMSYHDISLPSQNDLRYKYTGLVNNKGVLASKPDGGLNKTQNFTPEIAALFSSLKQDGNTNNLNNKQKSEKKNSTLSESHRKTRSKCLAETKDPNSM